MINRFFNSLLLLSGCLMLFGCTATDPVFSPNPDISYAAPEISQNVIDSSNSRQAQKILAILRSGSVKVFQVGDEVSLVLPSDRFFYQHTPRINKKFYKILNGIAEFIKQYNTVHVTVASYTDNRGDLVRNLALSRAQAKTIVKYLWQRHIDARLLSAVGYGAKHPIANNSSRAGRAQNRRIMITFRKYQPVGNINRSANG